MKITPLISGYSVEEEIANAVSHGIGALLSVAALTLLVTYAVLQGDPLRIISFSVYGTSLVLLFSASTLYHSVTNEKFKKLFKLLDHCAIYVLIAGTYTPLMLLTLKSSLAISMLLLIWGIALGGVLFKLKYGHKYKKLSLITYIVMGCISLIIIHKLYQQLDIGGLTLLAAGGLIYLLGVIFYVQEKIPFNHAIWHMFVLGGAGCHFFMMLHYV
ncbi:MAG: hemolysin III family protein [Alteromonadaceae bacterium]|nr:hemolysin III family protein [Alteromonadaceae bacterium]